MIDRIGSVKIKFSWKKDITNIDICFSKILISNLIKLTFKILKVIKKL